LRFTAARVFSRYERRLVITRARAAFAQVYPGNPYVSSSMAYAPNVRRLGGHENQRQDADADSR
jgi:hypothetical protein